MLRYSDLEDRLFGVPGRWLLRRCPVDGLVWLDPRPAARVLPLLYANYHTHRESDLRNSLAGRIWFGLAGVLAHVPVRPLRDIADAETMWLARERAGRLLDVGAGDGRFLAEMRARGWQVLGVEPDRSAVARARARGLEMLEGDVEIVPVVEAFDAVTLNNVIEHVVDPIATLRRCWALVAPGGRLVVLTPNLESLGHRVFGARWRGLEPPRHLHLFDHATLAACARSAGVAVFSVRDTSRAAPFVWVSSASAPLGMLEAPVALLVEALRPGLGEELLLVATKRT